MSDYNKTQLTPQKSFERHVYHRDMFAHYLRWSHVLKCVKPHQTILDFGCGSGEMYQLMYHNRHTPELYVGLDIRERTIEKNKSKFTKNCLFEAVDLCKPFDLGMTFDVITCFEVLEHIGHKNIDAILQNMVRHADENTRIFISTPNYDPTVGAAENHILGPDREIGEWDHYELQDKLSEYFVIEKKYGTFASIKDYQDKMNDWQRKMYDTLSDYYDVNLLSVIMAPMFPDDSRNTLWVLRKK